MKKTVPYITGDGVGVEITPSMQAIVNAAVKKAYGSEHEIEWIEVLAGEHFCLKNVATHFYRTHLIALVA